MRAHFDLEYSLNNDTLAIRPTRNGRLKDLVLTTVDDSERVWVFRNAVMWTDDDGDERIDHITRGVVNGTFEQGREFLVMCKEVGFVALCSGFFVPFSNGQKRIGKFGSGDKAEPCNDFYEDELKLVRWDLPSRDRLSELAGQGQ